MLKAQAFFFRTRACVLCLGWALYLVLAPHLILAPYLILALRLVLARAVRQRVVTPCLPRVTFCATKALNTSAAQATAASSSASSRLPRKKVDAQNVTYDTTCTYCSSSGAREVSKLKNGSDTPLLVVLP